MTPPKDENPDLIWLDEKRSVRFNNDEYVQKFFCHAEEYSRTSTVTAEINLLKAQNEAHSADANRFMLENAKLRAKLDAAEKMAEALEGCRKVACYCGNGEKCKPCEALAAWRGVKEGNNAV